MRDYLSKRVRERRGGEVVGPLAREEKVVKTIFIIRKAGDV